MTNTEEETALQILRQTGINIVEAAIVAQEALLWAKGRGNKHLRVRKCLMLGSEQLLKKEKSVTLDIGIKTALQERQHLRSRTRRELKYVLNRLLEHNPGLKRRHMRRFSASLCQRCIENAFSTARQQYKARLALSGVFSTAIRNGWCSENPLRHMRIPKWEEQRVPILSPVEIGNLLRAARIYRGGACLVAVGLMLYAGIRPAEVERLVWGQINIHSLTISLYPQHSKTGGTRHVHIYPPLLELIQESRFPKSDHERVCPHNWKRHWHGVRRAAGWDHDSSPWPQDCLRHTFASYHLSHFGDLNLLQIEMGHRSINLLRTRYLNMQGIGDAADFWRNAPR